MTNEEVKQRTLELLTVKIKNGEMLKEDFEDKPIYSELLQALDSQDTTKE